MHAAAAIKDGRQRTQSKSDAAVEHEMDSGHHGEEEIHVEEPSVSPLSLPSVLAVSHDVTH